MINPTRGIRLWLCSMVCCLLLVSCKKEPVKTANSRAYLMGFMNSAPRLEFDLAIQTLHKWETRADAAIISTEVPWDSLYSGESAQKYILNNYKGLVDYYRGRNFKLWVYIDPANGLDRGIDALQLTARHKSIAQADVQQIYQRFAFVMDSILKPDHMGLALETNLIRGYSPDSIYQGVKKAANVAAMAIKAYDKLTRLSVSIQVDYAWSKFGLGDSKPIDQDLDDFSFVEELGLSSYPYFSFDKPQDIPLDYYSKIVAGKSLAVFIAEGGWSSAKVGTYTGTLEKQRDYITRQGELLNNVNAIAYFQLTFTDIDLSGWPSDVPPNIKLFTSLGLVDSNLADKPALGIWDSLFKEPYTGK